MRTRPTTADPVRALRGASSAAGAADYILSLRYGNGAFGTQRRLSGRGRFVNLAPLTIDYHEDEGRYELIGSTKDAARETTWRRIQETGALCEVPRSIEAIGRAAGMVGKDGKASGQERKNIKDALRDREGVARTDATHKGTRIVHYALAAGAQ